MCKKYKVTFVYEGDEYLIYDGSDFSYAYELLLINYELNPVIEEYETYRLHIVK